MGNFACIQIRVFSTNDSLGYNDSNFHIVYLYSRMFKKRELSEKYTQREHFYVYSSHLELSHFTDIFNFHK